MHQSGSKWRKCIAIVLSLSIFTTLSIPSGTAHPAHRLDDEEPQVSAEALLQLLNPYRHILQGFKVVLPGLFSGDREQSNETLCGEVSVSDQEVTSDPVSNASSTPHTPVLPDQTLIPPDSSENTQLDSSGFKQANDEGEIVGDSSSQTDSSAGSSANGEIIEEPVQTDDATGELKQYIFELTSTQYTNVDPYVIFAIIERESEWNTDAHNKSSNASGLMQLVPKWYRSRMTELGYSDIFEPHTNIHLGVDSISSLLDQYGDIKLVLMLYSGNWNTAFNNYHRGIVSSYAKGVLQRAEELRGGG